MSDDLTRFLQQVAARRAREQAPPIQYLDERSYPNEQIPEVEIVEAVPAEPQRLSEQSHFGASGSHLAGKIEQADEKMEAHLHAVFDHDQGHERSVADTAEQTAPAGPAAELLRMLKKPDTVRGAFLLSLIFARRDPW